MTLGCGSVVEWKTVLSTNYDTPFERVLNPKPNTILCFCRSLRSEQAQPELRGLLRGDHKVLLDTGLLYSLVLGSVFGVQVAIRVLLTLNP